MRVLPAILLCATVLTGCGGDAGISIESATNNGGSEGNGNQGTNSLITNPGELEELAGAVEPDEILEPVFGAATGALEDVGQWSGVLSWPHVPVSMANLPDGRILTYSGSERRTWPTTEQTYSATWDPQTGQFVENFFRGHNMFCAALSLTSDGRVLVNGGRNSGNSPWTSLFDYRNGQWQAVQNMASGGRWYPTTLSLGDGSVMTAMGSSTNIGNPDLWYPDEGWRVLNGVDFNAMRAGRGGSTWFPQLSVAPTGDVFHYWDPQRNQMIGTQGNGSVRQANATSDGGRHPTGIQVMYDVGKLLMTGSNDGSWDTTPSNNAFTIDLNGSVPAIQSVDNMRHRRIFHQMIPLPTGEVLVVGGNTTGTKFRDNGSVMEPEIWNPQTGQWRGVANMAVPRDYHSTAMMLTDGRVLVGGGGYDAGNPNSTGTHQDAEVYSPPYLFNGNQPASRPTVVAEQASVDIGQWVTVTTSGDVQSFSFIKMGATTHAVNTDTRFYRPQFEAAGNNRYRVRINENPNVAIPGYWMLFALDADNVPSEAQVVRVTAVDTRLKNRATTAIASQSSTFTNNLNDAAKAIDGDLNGVNAGGSVAITQNELQPWWQLDLGREMDIDTIRLWNRTDCCSDRLNNVHVLVSSQPFTSTSLADTLAQSGVSEFPVNGVAGRQTDMPINQKGRYIRVQLAGTGILQLAEVQVFADVEQSVNWEYYEGAWTQLPDFDQLTPVAIGRSDGFNLAAARRADDYGFRMNANLLVPQDGNYTFATLSDDGSQLFVNGQLVVNNDGLHGRERRQGTINLPAGTHPIVVTYFERGGDANLDVVWSGPGFSERPVDSFAAPTPLPTNLALNASTRQSSTYETRLSASIAVDGVVGGNAARNEITHTRTESQPWWEVDLGEVSQIDYITLFNRTDCCENRLSNFYVHVSDVPFASDNLAATLAQAGVNSVAINGANGASRRIDLPGSGRYVRVQLAGTNPLSLAEVQVWGSVVAAPLEVQDISPTPVQRDTNLALSVEATGPAPLSYSWNFGDGSGDTDFAGESSVNHTYSGPGRYVVSVTVRDGNGDEVRKTFTQIVHGVLLPTPAQSSSNLLEIAAREQLWNSNPDNNSVTVTNTRTLSVVAEIPVDDEPVALTLGPDERVWVVSRDLATISIIDPQSLTVAGGYALPKASQPYGIVSNGSHAFVALEATGEIVKLAADGSVVATASVGGNPRHMTLSSDGSTLYVSRFITPLLPGEDTGNPIVDDGVRPYGGEVLVLGAGDLAQQDVIIVEHSDRVPSENQGPGLPNYLGAVAISPTGDAGWLPSKQDNILSGEVRGGTELTFDQTVRAITSQLDLSNNIEATDRRVDHDNSSLAHSAVFDSYGATLFVSLEGNRQIALVDTSSAIEFARFDTGFAPQGLRLSADGMRLYVHNYMSRSVGVYDISDIVNRGATEPGEVTTLEVVSSETLEPFVLRGKQLFHDARDDRLAALDYMSCAGCHVDGEHDGRVWDFTELGEGLRNTITLKGREGMGHGMLHWTGNFDELQDFEGQIRDFAGGSGLMDDANFAASAPPLGAAKAGRSSDLDALAAYMSSLDKVADSPYRAADGSFTDEAVAGQTLFATNGCATCHADEIFTDSVTAALHDVGSIMTLSGNRLGQTLTGFDTPTLLGVWRTPPYLHDGSAATLQDAISAHLDTTFTGTELNQLAAYLQQLDHSNNDNTGPPVPPGPAFPGLTNQVVSGAVVVDGSLSEWSALGNFENDAADAEGANPIDWVSSSMAHDDATIYISYSTDEPVVASWGYGIYIDTDGDRNTGFTGFFNELPIGADYLIESADVQRYTATGTGSDWAWESAGTAQRAINGNSAELSIARSTLGNPAALRLFLLGNNTAVGGTVLDYYPDSVTNAAAELSARYLAYSLAQSDENTPPLAQNQVLSVAANGALPLTLLASDVDGDVLQFTVTDQPANGVLSGSAPALTYTPDTDFTGTDSFTFAAYDGEDNSNLATVNISVLGVPPSNTGAVTLDGDLTEWQNRESFGLDPADANGVNDGIDWERGWMSHDADNLYIAWLNRDAVVDSWGYGIYIDSDNNRATGFTGFNNELPIGADILIENRYYLTYNGTGNNWNWIDSGDLPYASSGRAAELSISLQQLGNPQSIVLYFRGDNSAVGGSTVDYYPDGVVDSNSAVRSHSYTVDTQGLNRAPVANPQSLQTQLNTALAVSLTGADAENDTLSYVVTRAPSNGTLTGTAPALSYEPSNGYSGPDSFEYIVNDGQADSSPATISIAVQSENQQAGVINLSNPGAAITVDGNITDWASLNYYVADGAEQGAIDFQQVWMADDNTNLYLAWQQFAPVGQLVWGHQVYLDTDGQSNTGFTGFSGEFAVGADYVIEGTDLFRYNGASNTEWSWEFVGTVQTAVAGNAAEYLLPRALLGNPSSVEFILYGNGTALNSSSRDYYPDNANNPGTDNAQRRFGYNPGQ